MKNQEKIIDGVLRSMLFRIIYGKEAIIKKIILTDLDSKDRTLKSLKDFQKENNNEYVEVSTWRKCKDLIDIINEE